MPLGTVMGQSPLAGSPVPPGFSVNLLVSLGPVMVTVPNVVGAAQQAAVNTVLGAKLSVSVNFAASATVPEGSVISQSPAAGTSVAQASFVDLIVVERPDHRRGAERHRRERASAAGTAIAAASLTVGTITRVNHPTVPAGQVINQNPGPDPACRSTAAWR